MSALMFCVSASKAASSRALVVVFCVRLRVRVCVKAVVSRLLLWNATNSGDSALIQAKMLVFVPVGLLIVANNIVHCMTST